MMASLLDTVNKSQNEIKKTMCKSAALQISMSETDTHTFFKAEMNLLSTIPTYKDL
jgi:hypothetical protein